MLRERILLQHYFNIINIIRYDAIMSDDNIERDAMPRRDDVPRKDAFITSDDDMRRMSPKEPPSTLLFRVTRAAGYSRRHTTPVILPIFVARRQHLRATYRATRSIKTRHTRSRRVERLFVSRRQHADAITRHDARSSTLFYTTSTPQLGARQHEKKYKDDARVIFAAMTLSPIDYGKSLMPRRRVAWFVARLFTLFIYAAFHDATRVAGAAAAALHTFITR